MKTVLFLNLINFIIIFCYNKIVKDNSFEDFKNLRHLQSVVTEEPIIDPDPIIANDTDSDNSTNVNSNDTDIDDSDSDDTNSNDSDSTDLNPTGSSNSTIDDDSEENEEPLFIGVDNYYYDGSLLNFYAYFFIDDTTDYQETVSFSVVTISRILRILQDDKITCKIIDDSGKIFVYNCTYNYNGSIDSIRISFPGNKTDYAEYTLRNIKNQTGQIISSGDFFFITDCSIPDTSKSVIKGNTDYSINNNTEGVIYITNSTAKEEIPVTFIKEDGNGNYNLKLNLKNSLTKNLNNTVGKLNNKNATYVLFFKQNGNTTMNYKNNPSLNQAYIPKKKSSSGLSTGAIIAIIIPCVVALLAVVGLAFFLAKSSSGAAASTIPLEHSNMTNNTIGVSSSSNVVNKQIN